MTLCSMTGHGCSWYLGGMKMFGVLINLYGPIIGLFCFLVCVLKIPEAFVIAIMDPVSRFDLIGDEYLDVAP